MAAPSYVFTITRVARMLGEDEELLQDIAVNMEPEDGCLFVLDLDVASHRTASTTSKNSSPTSSGKHR